MDCDCCRRLRGWDLAWHISLLVLSLFCGLQIAARAFATGTAMHIALAVVWPLVLATNVVTLVYVVRRRCPGRDRW